MSFDLPIGIKDAPDAQAKIRALGDELGKVEGKANQARDAAGRFAKGAGEGAAKAKQDVFGLGAAFEKIAGVDIAKLNNAVRGATQALGEFGLAGQAIGGVASHFMSAIQGVASWRASVMFANDAMIEMRNRLRQVTTGQEELGRAMALTKSLADRTLTDWGVTIDTFSRVARVTQELGFGLQRTTRFTETLQKMMTASGRSGGEAASAMLQFSQALGSGRLQGDEFRSISENMPALLDAFAARLGVTRGALKELSSQGKITTDVMIGGIEDMATKADAAFAQMERTFSQRMQPTLNALKTPFAADKAFSNPVEMFKFFGDNNPAEFAQHTGIDKALSVFTDLEFPTGKVSEFNAQLGVFAEKAKEVARLTGSDVKPAFGSLYENIQLMTDAATKFPPALSAMDQALASARKQAQDTADKWKQAGRDLIGFGESIGGIAELVIGGALKGSRTKFGNDRTGGGLSDLEKLFHSIADPLAHFRRDMGLLDQLMKQNRISAEQYDETVLKLISHLSDADKMRAGVGARTSGAMLGVFGPQTEQGAAINVGIGGGVMQTGLGSSVGLAGPGAIDWGGKDEARDNPMEKQLADYRQGIRLTELWNKQVAEHRKQWEEVGNVLEKVLDQASDQFMSFLETGKASFHDFANAVLKDLTRIIIKELIAAAIKAYIGGGASVPTSFASMTPESLAGGRGASAGGNLSPSQLSGGGFADGGVWRAPFTGGGADSIPVRFDVSPGELVTFTPQSQQGGSGGMKQPVNVHLHDRDEAELEDFVIRVMRRNPAIRGPVSGR